MTTPSKRQPRRRFLVDQRLQFHMVWVWLAGVLSVAAVLLVLLYSGLQTVLDEKTLAPYLSEIRLLFRQAAIFMTVVMLLLGFILVLQSHRVAGPAHRLRKILGLMREGNLNAGVHLRKGDHLQDLAAAVEALRLGLRKDREDIAALARKAEAALPPDAPAAVRDPLRDIRRMLEEIPKNPA
ncbi:MAG: hypothetical protein V1809_02080 [Planctomycetota bacterium]